MLFAIGLVILTIGWIICMVMDIKYDVRAHPYYWGIGAATGLICGILTTMCLLV